MTQSDPVSRLALGTVQLGMNYGIANRTGRPERGAAHALLRKAWDHGIRVLDTAQAYGDAETVIGSFLAAAPGCDFQVVSKLPPGIDVNNADAIVAAVRISVTRIGRPLAAMLLHDEKMLDRWHDGLGEGLLRAIDEGLCATAGVSIYRPERFAQALDMPTITVIQAPFNALDRRLLDSGLLTRAAKRGRAVFLRGAFLQGLLTMTPEALPSHMAFAVGTLRRWHMACRDADLAPDEAALSFAMARAPEAQIVIGCETRAQLDRNLAIASNMPSDDALALLDSVPPGDAMVVNPSLWPAAERGVGA